MLGLGPLLCSVLQLSLPYGHLNPQGRCPPVTLPHNQAVPSPATPGPTTKKEGVLGTHLLTAVDSKSATQVIGKQVQSYSPRLLGPRACLIRALNWVGLCPPSAKPH